MDPLIIITWNDTVAYSYWFYNIFPPSIRQWTPQKVALILDGFSGHCKDIVDPEHQVDIYFSPPNVISIYQPLDQGIIAIVKTSYTYCVLNKML